jgi:beta-N-acetylhexosaminidase
MEGDEPRRTPRLHRPARRCPGERLRRCRGDHRAPQRPAAADASPSASASPTVDPAAPTGWGPTEGELAEAEELVGAMTLEEKAGTVLMPGFWGYDGRAPDPAEADANQRMHGVDTAAEAVETHGFGGVFLRPEVIADADQVATLTSQLHEVGDRPGELPLLISIDQEGGVGAGRAAGQRQQTGQRGAGGESGGRRSAQGGGAHRRPLCHPA